MSWAMNTCTPTQLDQLEMSAPFLCYSRKWWLSGIVFKQIVKKKTTKKTAIKANELCKMYTSSAECFHIFVNWLTLTGTSLQGPCPGGRAVAKCCAPPANVLSLQRRSAQDRNQCPAVKRRKQVIKHEAGEGIKLQLVLLPLASCSSIPVKPTVSLNPESPLHSANLISICRR